MLIVRGSELAGVFRGVHVYILAGDIIQDHCGLVADVHFRGAWPGPWLVLFPTSMFLPDTVDRTPTCPT